MILPVGSLVRYLTKYILRDLGQKIILLSGPRQVGKTYLSKSLMPARKFEYLNYDSGEHQGIFKNRSWSRDCELIIFDELHKMKMWKRWLKGVFDTDGLNPNILVTGSARLDTFRKVGDSLAGRFFSFRLYPLSVRELNQNDKDIITQMFEFGTFPEPFYKSSKVFAARWRKSHLDIILRQDLLDLEQVRSIKTIELLVHLLSERVGSAISISSLANDLQVSPHTIKHWIQILESLYVIFVVTPYSKNIAKAILREPKIYFFDIGRVNNSLSAKLENLVGLHLLKELHFREDIYGITGNLHYIRDKERREVDFAVLEDGKITKLVEVKESDTTLAANLKYFSNKIQCEHSFQVVLNLKRKLQFGNIKVEPVFNFLKNLEV